MYPSDETALANSLAKTRGSQDPTGTKISDYQYKVNGYVKLFMKNNYLKPFKYGDMNVRIGLALYTDNKSVVGERYREFWIDSVEGIFRQLGS